MICDKCYGKGVTHHYENGVMQVEKCECVKSSKNDDLSDVFNSVVKRYADAFKMSYKQAREELGVV